MDKIKVLFVCLHNAARSQMAEAFLRAMGAERFAVASAGLEPTAISPLAVEAMAEVGLDIAQRSSQNIFDLYRAGALFDYVISMCDEAGGESCPVFPGIVKRLHWNFPDPAYLSGDREKALEGMREIRDQIKAQVAWWMAQAVTSEACASKIKSAGRDIWKPAQPSL
jgi:arsenate reductase (thioredoxin)